MVTAPHGVAKPQVEYHVVVMDEKTKTVAISLHAHTLLKQLQDGEDASSA